MKNMAMLLLSLVLTGLGGCAMAGAVSDDGVTLTAARTGSKVLLTLRNNSATPVGYNLCSSALQRGGDWEPVRTGDICTMEIRTLDRGSSATFEKTLPSDLPAGQYRYVTVIDTGETRTVVGTNPFRVE